MRRRRVAAGLLRRPALTGHRSDVLPGDQPGMELKVGCGSTGIGGVGDKGLRPFPPRAEEERLEGLGSARRLRQADGHGPVRDGNESRGPSKEGARGGQHVARV